MTLYTTKIIVYAVLTVDVNLCSYCYYYCYPIIILYNNNTMSG